MLLYLFLGFLLMLLVVGLMAAFSRAEPAALARGLRWAAIGLAGAGIVLLPFIGRGSLVAFGPAVLIPLLMRMMMRRSQPWGGGWGRADPRPGQASSVETAWLSMTLDHDSGSMEGAVRAGSFAGRRLSSLDRAELLALLGECQAADADSAALVEAYLDRVHGAEWRAEADAAGETGSGGSSAGPGRAGTGGMSREEAYEILGLMPGAAPEAVKEAHRRLMLKLHPDHGGSTYLAAKLNQAKDLLIGG